MSPAPHSKPPAPAAVRAVTRMAVEAGTTIRDERRRRRWSLQSLAQRAGVSPAHIAQIEAGKPASLATYARVMVALDLRPELDGSSADDRRGSIRRDEDFVHASLVELLASRLRGVGLPVAIDEPYQHYQFAGRADLVAWDLGLRALLHVEVRTRFPNVQEALGSFASKRAYLGPILAERFQVEGRWASETHVMAALWSSEVVHAIRLRETTFRAACPGSRTAFDDWWAGQPPAAYRSSVLVVVDPRPDGRDGTRLGSLDDAVRVRPRVRDYGEAARLLRSR